MGEQGPSGRHGGGGKALPQPQGEMSFPGLLPPPLGRPQKNSWGEHCPLHPHLPPELRLPLPLPCSSQILQSSRPPWSRTALRSPPAAPGPAWSAMALLCLRTCCGPHRSRDQVHGPQNSRPEVARNRSIAPAGKLRPSPGRSCTPAQGAAGPPGSLPHTSKREPLWEGRCEP